jgi:nucleoside-diphosphate-sugar epimerase
LNQGNNYVNPLYCSNTSILLGQIMTSTVLVLGANGRLGQLTVAAFKFHGWEVHTHSLRPGAENPVLPSKINVVVFASNPPYSEWSKYASQHCAQAIEFAQRYNATLMFPGNVYNFGAQMPKDLKPNTPQEASTKKGIIRIEQEKLIREASKAGMKAIIIRAGDFFGCASGSWFDLTIAKNLIAQPASATTVIYPGKLDVPHAWAFVPDLANYFVQAANARAGLGGCEVLHFEGYTLTGNELLAALSAVTKRKLEAKSLPWPLIRAFSFAVPSWREIAEIAYLWNRPHRLDPEPRHLAALPEQRTPLPEALKYALRAAKMGV